MTKRSDSLAGDQTSGQGVQKVRKSTKDGKISILLKCHKTSKKTCIFRVLTRPLGGMVAGRRQSVDRRHNGRICSQSAARRLQIGHLLPLTSYHLPPPGFSSKFRVFSSKFRVFRLNSGFSSKFRVFSSNSGFFRLIPGFFV